MSDAVVVTGMGAASALGTGIEEHRAALWAGRDGFRAVTRFDTKSMHATLGATWRGWDGRVQPMPSRELDLAATATPFPLHELALVAAREAWSNANVACDPLRVALVFGTCFGHGYTDFSAVADRIASALEISGPRITISTACSSSTNAIGLARDLLRSGHADVVIAGGADSLLREAFAGFSALGVLNEGPCAPFSEPVGTTLGEGAAFFVLERASDAVRRGASTWATICGYGLSADAFHETTPDPSGEGVARAIRGALLDAGWNARDVDYVNAHATGTANNDRIEWQAIERELSKGGHAPLVSGSKGHLGHTQGAAGALELVLALLCQREGRVPPTLHFRGAREGCPADPIAQSEPRVASVARALKLSAAFGGANAVLAYARDAIAPALRMRAPVVVSGGAAVGSAGAFRMTDSLARSSGACGAIDLHALGVDPRKLDRSARFLTAAAALAISRDARRDEIERTGLFVAGTRMPPESSKRCTESIRARGVAGTSASAFARMSVNAPAGACAQSLGLLGPTTTISMGEGSGLLAIVLAAEWLAWREDGKRIVAGAVDELIGRVADEAEGAACLALERVSAPEPAAVVASSWAIAGPNRASEAASRAMEGRTHVDGVAIDGDARDLEKWIAPSASKAIGVIDARDLWGAAEATRSCVMTLVAAGHVAAGRARTMLVVASRGGSSVALVLERGDAGARR
jgi:3-oxoacyl-[acyl-carrier-protein] synthase II